MAVADDGLSRRDVLRMTAAGGVAATGAIASTGTAAADGWIGCDGTVTDYDGVNCAIIDSGQWLYEGATGLFSNGYDKEEVEDMQANNTWWELFERSDQIVRHNDGFLTELENWIEPADPTSGALETMVWSEIRASVFRSIENGDSQSDAISAAEDIAYDYLAVREKNIIRQWNEIIADIVRMWFTFVSDTELSGLEEDWDRDNLSHVDGEIGTEIPDPLSLEPHASGLDPVADELFSVGHADDTWQSDWVITDFGIEVTGYQLADGTTEDTYIVRRETAGGSPFELSLESAGTTNYQSITVQDPDGNPLTIVTGPDWDDPWRPLLDAVEEIRTGVANDLDTYVSGIYEAVASGDLDTLNILGPTEFINEFGDSDGVSRISAEMIGLGLVPPENLSDQVTISSADLEQNQTGHLFVRWDWSRLSSWEYAYDTDAGTIEIDGDSIMTDAVYYTVFLDDTDTEVEIAIDAADLDENGVFTYDPDSADYDWSSDYVLDRVELDAVGELRSFIPTGTTISDESEFAIFAYTNEDGQLVRETFSDTDSFTVEDVITEDGEHPGRLSISGYNQQTRDPAMSLDQAVAMEQNRDDVDDLSDDGGGGGGGLFGDVDLGGPGTLVLVGGIAALLLRDRG